MAKKLYLKTGKAPLIASTVVAILFIFFGIFLYFASEGGMPLIFLIIWLVACGFIIINSVYHLRRYDPDKGFPIAHMEDENDFDERLRKLEALNKEGLLSDQEYDLKRKEIMQEEW